MARGGGGGRLMAEKTSRLMGAAITFESIKSLCDTPLSVALLIPSVDVYFRNTRKYQERVLIHKSVLVEQVSRSTQKKVNRLHHLDTHTYLDILNHSRHTILFRHTQSSATYYFQRIADTLFECIYHTLFSIRDTGAINM